MLYNRDKLTRCTREEYANFTRTLNLEQSRPVEATSLAVMQWVNDDNVVIAQSIYQNGKAEYLIRQ